MIDTLYIGLEREIPNDFLAGVPANFEFEPASMPGWSGRIETTKPGSHYYRFHRADFILTLRHESGAIRFTGPIQYDFDVWLVTTCRINVPRLTGLPEVWLPETDDELRQAFLNLQAVTAWLPLDWLSRSKVKEIHLAMNFKFSGRYTAAEFMEAHRLMRHNRVRLDPRKLKEHHRSLYWTGENLVICLYEKTFEACAKIAKDKDTTVEEIRRRYRLDELLRLEFRVKSPLLGKLLNGFTSSSCIPVVGPPLPETGRSLLPLAVTCEMATFLFRSLAFDFGDLPVRVPERFPAKTLLAMLTKAGFSDPDGLSVIEFASRYMNDRSIREVKKLAASIEIGRPVIRWQELLGDTGFGPHAAPKPDCFAPFPQPDPGSNGNSDSSYST